MALPSSRATTRTLLVEKDGGGTVVSTVRRTVLPGGLRVVTEEMSGVRSASIGVWVGVGSRDESPTMNGASHFLEHLLFKGTPSRSAWDISASLDLVGGEFNAFTSAEYTCFHARVLDVDLPVAVDVLGDVITSSLITSADVEAEREVILDEIAMHDDDPEDVVQNAFQAIAFANTGLGRPIAGTEASIKALTRAQIRRHYRTHYVPTNMVVAVAGNISHAAVVRRVKQAFAPFLTDATTAPKPRRGGRVRPARAGDVTIKRPFEQVHFQLGVDAFPRTDDRRYALGVLSAVLGGGASSRLFQEVREERGLAYSIYSFAAQYADQGAFCIGGGTLPAKLDATLGVVRQEVAKLAADGITDEELRRGQGQLRGARVLGLEDTGSRMSRIGRAELLYDELPGIGEVLDRIDAVTVDEVHQLARTLFTGRETLAIVRP